MSNNLNPQNTTLIDLIDAIMHYDGAYSATRNRSFINLKKISINKLSERMSISKPCAAIFAVIFYNSVRGIFITKANVSSILMAERSILIHRGINELTNRKLICEFKERSRKPETRYYCENEIEEMIVKNIIPVKDDGTRIVSKSQITFKQIEDSFDYCLLLNGKVEGTIYFSIMDEFEYVAVLGNVLVSGSDDLNELLDNLNELYLNNKLNFN